MIDVEQYEVAWYGNLTVNDTSAHTNANGWKGFYVSSAAVIAHIYVDGGSVDVQASMITTPANGIVSGVLKTMRNGVITSIQLTSGQVEMINDNPQG